MTRDEDIGRVLDEWFVEGPTQMPGRFFNATFDRIDRVPDRQFVPGFPRLSTASRRRGLAAAAAVLVLTVGVAGASVMQNGGVGAAPSPLPSPSASPTIDPSAIETKWSSVGERPIMGHGSDLTSVEITFDAASLAIDSFPGSVDNGWSLSGPGNRLAVRMQSTFPTLKKYWNCEAGQEGTYDVSLSTDGEVMTLAATTVDTCSTRGLILEGSWTRWPCPNPKSLCEPELAPGAHDGKFTPYDDGNGGHGPPPFLDGFSYTVPAGWSELDDSTFLVRWNDPGTMSVNTILDVAPHTQDATCPDAADKGAGRTVAAMADWLTRVPGLATTTPVPIEIGGHQGLVIDVSVVPGWTTPQCQFNDEGPMVMTFADPAPVADGGVFVREYVSGEGRARYVLLDLGTGHNLLIEIKAPDEATWDELVRAAMPIVQTFRFMPASGS